MRDDDNTHIFYGNKNLILLPNFFLYIENVSFEFLRVSILGDFIISSLPPQLLEQFRTPYLRFFVIFYIVHLTPEIHPQIAFRGLKRVTFKILSFIRIYFRRTYLLNS